MTATTKEHPVRKYTITITPDDGLGAATVISLEVNGATPRITKLELTAGEGASLSTEQLPAINLEMLLASVLPAAASTAAVTAAAAPAIAGVTRAPASQAPEPANTGDESVAVTRPKPRAARKATAGKTAKAPEAKKKPSGATRSAVPAAQPATGRTYRTMPDDFVSTFNQAKTIAAVADYYAVPHHTAQGWINTARRRGLIAPARKRNSR
jgi:hypothetical protein